MSLRGGSVVVLTALTLAPTLACHRHGRDRERLLAEAVQSFAQLQPTLAEVKARLSGLRADADLLAARVPGGAELRARYFSADEVAGVLDAKMKWLSAQIASAKADVEKAQVSSLRDAVTRTTDEIRQVSAVSVELLHEKARLQRVAALLQAPYEHDLTTGYRVKAARDGIEARLIGLLDGEGKPPRAAAVEFDRLTFTGDELAFPACRSQIENVAQILKAYPDARLRIGAPADAKPRAQAVKRALVQAGIEAHRLQVWVAGQRPGVPIAALVIAE